MGAAWEFWIDRGGTFTDVVARRPDGGIETRKLLSEAPERYPDAAVEAIRDCIGLAGGAVKPGQGRPSSDARSGAKKSMGCKDDLTWR